MRISTTHSMTFLTKFASASHFLGKNGLALNAHPSNKLATLSHLGTKSACAAISSICSLCFQLPLEKMMRNTHEHPLLLKYFLLTTAHTLVTICTRRPPDWQLLTHCFQQTSQKHQPCSGWTPQSDQAGPGHRPRPCSQCHMGFPRTAGQGSKINKSTSLILGGHLSQMRLGLAIARRHVANAIWVFLTNCRPRK